MPIFDYSCDFCGEIKIDQLVKDSKEVVFCDCNEPMTRALCTPKLIGFDKYGRSKKAKK